MRRLILKKRDPHPVPFSVGPLKRGSRIGSLLEMQEAERRRISQELHDDLGQRLALLEIQIDRLEQQCIAPAISKGLKSLRERLGEMDQDVHRICYRLHPVILEKLGLIVALDSLCREFSQGSGIRVDFIHHNLPKHLAKSLSLCAYRMVQEALHNVSKHAKAAEATVSLRFSTSSLEVTVEDSGRGFDALAARTTRGLGLVTIDERVRGAGGRFSIKSRPGRGTKVIAVIPI